MEITMIWILAWVLALVFAFWKLRWVESQSQGTDEMAKIAGNIRSGAMAFLNREYRVLGIFVVVVAILLFLGYDNNVNIALAFIFGALCSGLAGFIGMWSATASNSRTTNAARTSLNDALIVAFSGGSVMGMCVAGLGVMGLSLLYMGLENNFDDLEELTTSLEQIMNEDGPIFVAIKVPAEVENLPIGMRERRPTRSRSQTINDLRSELKIS